MKPVRVSRAERQRVIFRAVTLSVMPPGTSVAAWGSLPANTAPICGQGAHLQGFEVMFEGAEVGLLVLQVLGGVTREEGRRWKDRREDNWDFTQA